MKNVATQILSPTTKYRNTALKTFEARSPSLGTYARAIVTSSVAWGVTFFELYVACNVRQGEVPSYLENFIKNTIFGFPPCDI